MLVKFLIENDDESSEWRDFYIDVDRIDGFYTPDLFEGEDDSVNVLFNGRFMTFKQEEHLVKYLLSKRFYGDD